VRAFAEAGANVAVADIDAEGNRELRSSYATRSCSSRPSSATTPHPEADRLLLVDD
jgi:hypothetical protein